jgi:hypothetical protein
MQWQKLTFLRGRIRFVRFKGWPGYEGPCQRGRGKSCSRQRKNLPNQTTQWNTPQRLDSRVGLNKWAVCLIRRRYPRR